MDPLQPFLVLSERSGVVSFGTGFSICHLPPASRRTEKGRCPQAALHCRRDLLRTVPCVLCFLESRAQRKGCLFIAATQMGVLGAVAFRYNVLFTPSAVLLVWLLAMGKGGISRLLSTKPFLWLAGLSPYGFLIHQVLIRYMEWAADKFSLTVHPVVWTLTVYLLTLCLSSFYKALEHRVRQRLAKQ